ncbi:universal stress protein [Natronorubrum daqingense]|uniref:Nucleotide-binding universal stress protein, UspA family n=1 Tax=Natronorubrum daqingense TaxID=588898 RepID=A0A1N7FSF7_9EURY|nr:universal stress protein [Natronorubrum daqingense]APX97392.1 universal stress protein UspA [Natronorubrum daqingense]SIS03302.1 Nucleotide-binding universal stress protein, UspA family [Natronorubrum daqingense]
MTVLVAYDGSEPAQKAVKQAFDEHGDEELVLLRVVELADGYTEASIKAVQDVLGDRRESAAEELRADLPDLVDTESVDFRTEVATGNPAREIVSAAEEYDVDQIVIGSHGRSGVSRVLLGSVAESVVRRSPVSVTVVR